ncbi:flippase, partial [Patescibacteria group bacterium]|nr:flippase [Patescibacteria group bacterium]
TAINDVGITPVIIREVAKKTIDAELWSRTVVGIKLITMPLTAAIAFILPGLLGYDAEVIFLVRLAVVIMLADTISLSFYGILRGMQNLRYESLGIFAGQIFTAAVGLSLMLTGAATLPLLIIALMAGSFWNMLFSIAQVVRHLGWRAITPTYKQGWRPMKIALAFFLAAMFVKVYSYVDSLILGQMIGKHAVGIYAVAYKLTYAFQFLPLAFVAALYPTMSATANDPTQLKKTFLQAMWYLALIGMPIIFGIWALAPEIIQMFYGEEYAESVLPLQILIFVLIPIFFDFPIGSLLNATNRQNIKTSIMGVAMVINVVANFLLIPRFGIEGASISGLISFTFLFVAGWFFTRKVIFVSVLDLLKQVGGLTFAAVLMALVVILAKGQIHFALTIPIGALVYFGAAFATKSLTLNHLKSAKNLLRKKSYEDGLSSNA